MKKTVKKFVNECAEGLKESESWGFISEIEMFADEGYGSWGKGIKSPIEQILFTAILHNIKINNISMADPDRIGGFDVTFGITIFPQFKIGKYKVDFKITNSQSIFNYKKNQLIVNESKSILVECDSQEWHERTEKERRYEKARDRYFAKHNLKIFHYTGREIINKPHKIAAEILREVLGYNCDTV